MHLFTSLFSLCIYLNASVYIFLFVFIAHKNRYCCKFQLSELKNMSKMNSTILLFHRCSKVKCPLNSAERKKFKRENTFPPIVQL